MSRWRVERGFWWVAMQVDEQGREIPGTAKRFTTHAQALAYADQMSRTITATLPRVGETVIIPSQHDAKDEPPLLVRFTNRMTWIYQHSDDYNDFIVLDADHLEPLALALLAHARKERP